LIWQHSTSFTAEECLGRGFISVLFELIALMGPLEIIPVEKFLQIMLEFF
jgi:ABC-type uncharacterized transport system permease subunit